MTQFTEQQRWEALMRGQVMSATINKFTVILRMLDQKAQAMILLNSLIIPLCIRSLEGHMYGYAAVISLVTAVISILASIMCIYPKRRYRKNGDRELNLLHFNDIGHMPKEDFLSQIMPHFNDPSKLAALVVNDLYDASRYSIRPKFLWLKIAYVSFAAGNFIAVCLIMLEIFKLI